MYKLIVKQHLVDSMPGAYPEDQMAKAKSSLGWDHLHTNLFLVGHTLSVAFAFRFGISSSNSPLIIELYILIPAPGAASRNDGTIRNANPTLLFLLLFRRLM